ncbi:MAG: anaerobic sulfite reductase subunit AsrB, partial [Nitrosarchaeum sp.]|nr:anaerobic sulfite reductase subunit AsrB [Nitrosarchaeum sp.]
YLPFPVRVLSNRRETDDIFTLRLAWTPKHQPGQFVQVSLPGIGEAPISISSYSDQHMDLSIRKVGTVTNALERVQEGEDLLVRGPYGRGYDMSSYNGNNLILIGGGCGVAPLRGVIEYIERHRTDYKNVTLFLGYRTPGDILYGHSIAEWEKTFNVKVSVDKAPAEACYTGKVGFITELLQKEEITNKEKIAIMCGPPIMMNLCIDILKKKRFNDDQIFLSAERLMYCAIGKCGHCMIRGKYTCVDGPVFRYDEVKDFGRDF